jgi:MFS family permease
VAGAGTGSAIVPARVIKNPKAILALLTALNLLNYLDRYVLSAVLKPLQDELHLSDFVGGSLSSVFLIGFFVTSPLFGWWADRSGPAGRKALVVFGVVVWSLATLASGLARGPASLLLARAVVGVGEASYVTIAPTIIDDVAPSDRKSAWLAYFYTAIPVGSALGYLIGGSVEHATHDWRQAFYVAGGPGMLLGFLCLLIRDPANKAPPPSRHVGDEVFGAVRTLARIPLYRAVVLGQCAYTFAIGGFAYWAPKYVAARYDLEPGHASFVFGLVTVAGGAIGTLLGGRIGDRATRGRTADDPIARGNLVVCGLATFVAVPLAAAAVAATTGNLFFGVVLACEIALFIPGGPYNVAVLRSVPPRMRASAMAISIFASHLLGDLWSPPLIGLVADHASMALGMLVCPAGFALGAFFWWRGRTVQAASPALAP